MCGYKGGWRRWGREASVKRWPRSKGTGTVTEETSRTSGEAHSRRTQAPWPAVLQGAGRREEAGVAAAEWMGGRVGKGA